MAAFFNSIIMQHIQVSIEANELQQEFLIGILSQFDANGFEQTPTHILAYFDENNFAKNDVKEALKNFKFITQTLKEQNWNKEWESNFQPVVVDNFCGIRAGFHQPIKEVQYEIIITPKMSFGTGHHATTYMMIKSLQDINVKNKKVFDFGTGTGVLAILADKEGASEILAIDNDEWSVLNASENILRNDANRIKVELSENPDCQQYFDIILANINKHIIIESLPALTKQLNPSGFIICSGFMQHDINDINAMAAKCNLIVKQKKERERSFASLRMTGRNYFRRAAAIIPSLFA